MESKWVRTECIEECPFFEACAAYEDEIGGLREDINASIIELQALEKEGYIINELEAASQQQLKRLAAIVSVTLPRLVSIKHSVGATCNGGPRHLENGQVRCQSPLGRLKLKHGLFR